MFSRIVLLLLLLLSGGSTASLLSQQGLPTRYMQTTEDAAIWAQVGNGVINVGNIRAGQILAVVPTAADYFEFRFGFGTGFIDKGHLEEVQGKQRVEDSLGDLNKPLSNQNLITWKDTPVYNAPNTGSPPLALWQTTCVIPFRAS